MILVLGTFGLLDFTMLWPVLAWRTFWNLWTVYFFNFPIFFMLQWNADMWEQLYKQIYSKEQHSSNRYYFTVTFQTTEVKPVKEWTYCAPPSCLTLNPPPNGFSHSHQLSLVFWLSFSPLYFSLCISGLSLCRQKKGVQVSQPEPTPTIFILPLTYLYTVKPVYNRT
jgi:hypothetical protein